MTAFWWGVLVGAVGLGWLVAGVTLLLFWPLIKARAKRELRNEAAAKKAWARSPFASNGAGVVDRRRSSDFNLVTRGQVRSPAQSRAHDL